jgi:hypothetical protein
VRFYQRLPSTARSQCAPEDSEQEKYDRGDDDTDLPTDCFAVLCVRDMVFAVGRERVVRGTDPALRSGYPEGRVEPAIGTVNDLRTTPSREFLDAREVDAMSLVGVYDAR